MPELPEVETVCRGLTEVFPTPIAIAKVEVCEARLREPIVPQEVQSLQGSQVTRFFRRAKYMLWEVGEQLVVSHLGMTGSWRVINSSLRGGAASMAGTAVIEQQKPHDHVLVYLHGDPRILVYNDPRRFGLFRVIPKANWQEHPYFQQLGPEPLEKAKFTADQLLTLSRGRSVAVKNFLMDQKVVVGIGNIYASEILFRSGVRPHRLARRVSRDEFARIVRESRRVLKAAIEKGGTTFRDFRQTGGGEGHFYQKLKVYERAGQPCRRCQALIRQTTIGGRSSYWCPTCQK